MQLVEAEIRPRKPLFSLMTAEAILDETRAALAGTEPKSTAGRAVFLAVLRRTLANARKSAEAELMAHGRGLRCAENIAAAEDEIIRAVFRFATREVYPVDNPSGA